MAKIRYALIFIWILTSVICCKKNKGKHFQPRIQWSEGVFRRQYRRLTFKSSQKNVYKQAAKIFQKFRERLEKEEIERKRLEEELSRRKIYAEHLLVYQRGSNILRDFHTNRF